MGKIVRVLKPGKLMGEERKYGDLLPPAKYFSLPINVQTSLESANHVEIDVEEGDASQYGSDIESRMLRLERRIEILENVMMSDTTEIKLDLIQPKNEITPTKGNMVTFIDNGVEITGEVTSIVKKNEIARVKTSEDKFAVSFKDLTIIN